MSFIIPITIIVMLALVWGGIIASIQPEGLSAKAFYTRLFLLCIWLFGVILLAASMI